MVTDARPRVTHEYVVHFDSDLPRFNTDGGVHTSEDGRTVTSPPLMWVAALDLLLQRMQEDRFPFEQVAAVSGSGQQHGSVYLLAGTRETLAALTPAEPMHAQLAGIFALEQAPVWMDSSTTTECRALENALGGPQALAELTGSRAYERFTGNQITKIHKRRPEAYSATERIALVSSFMASLFIGDYAPIEPGDGAGMNLMDLKHRVWAPLILPHVAPDLAPRLGPIVPSHACIGNVAPYMSQRYGFQPDCAVICFSGDNPNSLAGLLLQQPGDLAISMGTSDTMFGALATPSPSADEGHVFGNPIDPDGYMAMIVRQNGSLVREDIRERHNIQSWDDFAALLDKTAPGNDGCTGFYFRAPEITPPTQGAGTFRFDNHDQPVADYSAEQDVRALLESQFLALRLHGESIGLNPRSVLATGGASENKGILQVIANVFGVGVYAGEQKNSASLGAAYRALHGWTCHTEDRLVPFADVLRDAPSFSKAADPDPTAHATYTQALPRYARLEEQAVSRANRETGKRHRG